MEEALIHGKTSGEVLSSEIREEMNHSLDGGRGVDGDGNIALGEPKTTKTLPKDQSSGIGRLSPLFLEAEVLPLALQFLCLAQNAKSGLEAWQEVAVGRH